ncbi:MAG: cytochrome c [Bacteroidota bacterium]|nr:cytochrome c [Bacteroidota bacterium]
MRTKFLLSILALLPAFCSFAMPANTLAEEGKALFTNRCAACHNVNKTLTGPALAGVDQRHTIAWITRFVHSSQTVIKSGDKEAIALFEKFNKITMPDHPDLTEADIKGIVEYIKSETKTAATDAAPFRKPGKIHPNYTPLSIDNYGYFTFFVALVFVLVGALLALVKVKSLQRDLNGEV